jgi:hypothetical protein
MITRVALAVLTLSLAVGIPQAAFAQSDNVDGGAHLGPVYPRLVSRAQIQHLDQLPDIIG